MANEIPDPADLSKPFHEPAIWDAYKLRRFAEAVSSRRTPRGDISDLVEDRKHNTLEWICRNQDDPMTPGTIIEIDTRAVRPDRPPVGDIALTVEGVSKAFGNQFDAVFCTEAAVEKFVLPYLASESLWLAAHYVQMLSQAWYGFVPVPSNSSMGATEEPIPFAIGHTPDSEFTPLESNGPPELYHLHVLLKKGDKLTSRPLADLIREREAEGHGTGDPAPRTHASPDAG